MKSEWKVNYSSEELGPYPAGSESDFATGVEPGLGSVLLADQLQVLILISLK